MLQKILSKVSYITKVLFFLHKLLFLCAQKPSKAKTYYIFAYCDVIGHELSILLRGAVVDVIKVVLCYAVRLTQHATGDGVTLRVYLRR